MAATTTYWKANCIDDHNAYSIRRRTKKEVLNALATLDLTLQAHADHDDKVFCTDEGYARFEAPEKIEIVNDGQMDLIQIVLGEGGGSY